MTLIPDAYPNASKAIFAAQGGFPLSRERYRKCRYFWPVEQHIDFSIGYHCRIHPTNNQVGASTPVVAQKLQVSKSG